MIVGESLSWYSMRVGAAGLVLPASLNEKRA
jgi:hypothetical protein